GRIRTMGAEDFATVDSKAVGLTGRGGLEIRDRRTRFWLAHGNGHERLACEQPGQVARFLLGGRVLGERADRAEVVGVNEVGASRTDLRDLLDRQYSVHERAAAAPSGLRKRDADQSICTHEPGDLPWKPLLVCAGDRPARQVPLCKLAHRIPMQLLLGREAELHVYSPPWPFATSEATVDKVAIAAQTCPIIWISGRAGKST